MHRMVVDLLDLARLDSGTADLTMSPLDVKALLNAVVEKFAPLAEKAGVTLKPDLVEEIPALMGDGDRLAQVFINLVDNALKYTPRGGAVTLRARVEKAELIASVSDTGVGISPEALPHVFDRFYQGDPSRKGGEKHGAGLGLAIVKEIVQAHGGRITVRSQAGEGTIFTLSLPLAGPASITPVSGKK